MYKIKHISVPINYKVIVDSFKLMENQIGLKELTGRNDGKHIEEYHNLYHLAYNPKKTNYPYCQMAQGYWLYVANGRKWDGIEFMKTAGTLKAVRLAEKEFGLCDEKLIHKHDLLYWKKPNSSQGHVERVFKDFNGLSGQTIGANTSNGKHGSQREGNGIFERVRDFGKPIGKLQPYAIIHFDKKYNDITDSDNLRKTV